MEICAEIIESNLLEGNEVTLLTYDRKLNNCYLYAAAERKTQKSWHKKLKVLVNNFSGRVLIEHFNVNIPSGKLQHFSNIDELLEWKDGEIFMGRALCALYTQQNFSTYQFSFSDEENLYFQKSYNIWRNCFAKFLSIENKFDDVYIHNGRFPIDKAIANFCLKNNKSFFCYDTADIKENYRLTHNATIHSLEYIKNEMDTLWYPLCEEKLKKGELFFTRRKNHVAYGSFSFTKHQQKSLIPDQLKTTTKEIITIFNSTAEEIFTVDDYCAKSLFENEYEGLKAILSYFNEDKEKLFVLRIHPHLYNCDNYQLKYLFELKKNYKNLIIIPPEDKIDTYALMEISSKIIVFSSTMGIESAFWGKPVVLLGRSVYENFSSIFVPKNQDELYDWLNKSCIEVVYNKDELLKYGYWDLTYGIPYKHSITESIGDVKYKGIDLREYEYVSFSENLKRLIVYFYRIIRMRKLG